VQHVCPSDELWEGGADVLPHPFSPSLSLFVGVRGGGRGARAWKGGLSAHVYFRHIWRSEIHRNVVLGKYGFQA
jgi:hypothetical protein